MNRIRKAMIVLGGLLLCGNASAENYLTSVAPSDGSWIEVDRQYANYVLQPAACVKTLKVKSNLNVTVSNRPSWVKYTKLDNETFELEIKANTAAAARTGSLVLRAKDRKTLTLNMTQLGSKGAVMVDKDVLNVYGDRLVDSLYISANMSYTMELPEWLRQQNVDGDKYYFVADKLYDAYERTGTITLKDSTGAVAKTVTVNQKYATSNWFEKPCFAVISDIHIGNDLAQTWHNRITRILKTLSNHDPKIQTIIIIGDLADHGLEDEYKSIVSYFSNPEYRDQNIDVQFIRGNHDNIKGASGRTYFSNIIKQSQMRYIDIKGYPFIMLGSDATDYRGDNCYNATTLSFLQQSLIDANDKYPGKPIFVFQHVLPKNTMIGSTEDTGLMAYANGLTEIFEKYPQVIDFSGHTHSSITDPHQIWQGTFTAVNDGSGRTDNNPTKWAGYRQVGLGNEIDSGAVTEGLVVYVDQDDRVVMERWNTARGIKYDKEWEVIPPFDGSTFTYKSRTGGRNPQWPSGAKVTVKRIASDSIHVTFPVASDDDDVCRYLVNVVNSAGTKVVSQLNQFSLITYGSQMPKEITVPFGGVPAGIPLNATVYAQDFYELNSTTLKSDAFTLE